MIPNTQAVAETAQRAWANIPPKANCKELICFSPQLYKARNLDERFFNKFKHFHLVEAPSSYVV
jgi:transposase